MPTGYTADPDHFVTSAPPASIVDRPKYGVEAELRVGAQIGNTWGRDSHDDVGNVTRSACWLRWVARNEKTLLSLSEEGSGDE